MGVFYSAPTLGYRKTTSKLQVAVSQFSGNTLNYKSRYLISSDWNYIQLYPTMPMLGVSLRLKSAFDLESEECQPNHQRNCFLWYNREHCYCRKMKPPRAASTGTVKCPIRNTCGSVSPSDTERSSLFHVKRN